MRFAMVLSGLLLLSGCQLFDVKLTASTPVQVGDWLRFTEQVAAMNTDQVQKALTGVEDNAADLTERFQFALLQYQLPSRDSWVVARDRLRGLRQQPDLPVEARRLVTLVEQLAQQRINAEQRNRLHDEAQAKIAVLQQQLTEQGLLAEQRQAEVLQLEEKIQALTSLEDSMRQRREKRGGQ